MYVQKVYVEPESPHYYFVVLSMLDPDTAPLNYCNRFFTVAQVAKYMNNHSGTHFFKPFDGALMEVSKANTERTPCE